MLYLQGTGQLGGNTMNTVKVRITIACMSLIVMSLLFITSGHTEINQASIVGAWLFDEGGGTTAVDSSGNGHDGTIVGGAKYVDGKFGTAIQLDGIDDWVHVPSIGNFEQVTIAVWVNMTGRVGQWRVIINNDGWKAGDIHHQLHPNNKVEFSIHSNPGGNDTFGTFLFDNSQLNKWHHLATVYNGTEGWIRFYVDGELDVENKWGGNPGTIGPARIGSWDGGGREWQGMLDELIIFNVALEEDDIQTLMENGLRGILSVEPVGKVATIWGKIKNN